MKEKTLAVVLAAGAGRRMHSDVQKQYLFSIIRNFNGIFYRHSYHTGLIFSDRFIGAPQYFFAQKRTCSVMDKDIAFVRYRFQSIPDGMIAAYDKLFLQEEELKKQGITVTDDAMVVETLLNHPVKLVKGSYEWKNEISPQFPDGSTLFHPVRQPKLSHQ